MLITHPPHQVLRANTSAWLSKSKPASLIHLSEKSGISAHSNLIWIMLLIVQWKEPSNRSWSAQCLLPRPLSHSSRVTKAFLLPFPNLLSSPQPLPLTATAVVAETSVDFYLHGNLTLPQLPNWSSSIQKCLHFLKRLSQALYDRDRKQSLIMSEVILVVI